MAELAFELAAFAPPHAHVSVERAARVLRVRSDAGEGGSRLTLPQRTSSVAPPARDLGAGSQEGSGPIARGVPASSGWGSDPAAPSGPALGLTDRSWGGTQPPAWSGRARARALAWTACAAGVVSILAAVGWFTARPATQPVASPGASVEPATPQDERSAAPEHGAGEHSGSAPGGATQALSSAAPSAATPQPGSTAAPGVGSTAAPGSGSAVTPGSGSTAAPGVGSAVTPAPSASSTVRPSVSASPGSPQRVPNRPPRRPPSQESDLFSDPR
jgi:serine/threonine-protein kinase